MKVALSKPQLGWLLAALLIFPVIWFDAAYGVLSFFGLDFLRVSFIYRTILLFIGLYFAYTLAGPVPWIIKSLILIWGLMLLISTYPDGNVLLTKDITHLLRRLYPFAILLSTLALLNHYGDKTTLLIKGIAHYGVIFSVVMLFSFFTGLGYESYGDYAFGIKSFFVGGNDIGLAVLISLAVLFSQLFYRLSFWNLLRVGACFLAVTLLGTKAGWAASSVTAACFAIIIVLFSRAVGFKERLLKWSVMSLILSSFTGAAIYVQANFDDFKFQIEQAEQIIGGASPRMRLVESYKRNLENYTSEIYLTGDGAALYEGIGREYYLVDNNKGSFSVYREIEQEWFDAVGHYGVPYAVTLFSMHCLFILFSIILFVRRPTVEHFALNLGLAIYLGHGIFAGHAFVSGQPSHLVGVIYALTLYRLGQSFNKNTVSAPEAGATTTGKIPSG
ncbi:O-antigen ligase family protein [Pseudidiomarina halophila]|uniref:O-antigen ligase domain-containing protein n=1 Tax=Pseudidiomarina halophila TaxID=1449799 RepID=A0A432XZ08_9GAMM|nr:O-antigen ligase family protein [Pseudidiomarina halophila]RUO53864.1 hypothetical protein CWI69_00010 [Pseudidiomarina halophila]